MGLKPVNRSSSMIKSEEVDTDKPRITNFLGRADLRSKVVFSLCSRLLRIWWESVQVLMASHDS